MHSIDQLVFRLYHFKHRPGGYEALSYSYFMMKFALGMVDTFGIVFIYLLGETMAQGIWLVAVYAFVQRLLTGLFLVPAGKLVNRIGYRKIMLVGLFLIAFKLWILARVTSDTLGLLFLTTIPGAIYICFYYLGYHGLFLDDGDDTKLGEQMGYLEMLARTATVVSPFIAGIILERAGFSVLFTIGTILLLVSAIPLFMMPKHKHAKISVGFRDVWRELNKHPRFAWSQFFMNIQYAVQDYFWPIYMFMIIGSYAAFGSVFSLVMIASSLAVYVSGKTYDKRSLHKLYPFVAVLQSLLWFARFLSQTVLSLVTADILARLSSPVWWMKIRRYELSKGEKMDSVVFGMAHEYVVTAGKLLGLVVCMTLLVWSGYDWVVLAIPASAAVLLSGWMVRNR